MYAMEHDDEITSEQWTTSSTTLRLWKPNGRSNELRCA